MKSLTQIIKEAYNGQPVNSADVKTIKATTPNGKTIWKKVPTKRNITKEETGLEEKTGLWDNIHAKRERIKNGSGERMRKPGSEGAPTKQDFIDSKSVKEATEDDEREYDFEGEMAKSQLYAMIEDAKYVISMMEDDTNLPEWLQTKITLAADYISTVSDYLTGEDASEDEEDDEE